MDLIAILLGLLTPHHFTTPKATPLEMPLAGIPWGL